jgi:predicted RNA-binding protein with PUA domain
MRTTLNQTNPIQTVRQVLPYSFQLLMNGKLCIKKTSGQMLIVSRGEVEHILERDDLDVHRRRMYEAALEEWKKEEVH